jgi:carbon storage regulator
MLVLSRKKRESVVVGGGGGLDRLLKVTVLEIVGGKVKLGFEADGDIPVHRLEIWERICANGELGMRREGQETPHARSD